MLIKRTSHSHSREPQRKNLDHLVERVYLLTYTALLCTILCHNHHLTGHPLLPTMTPIILTISPITNPLIPICPLTLNCLRITDPTSRAIYNHQTPIYYTCLSCILSNKTMKPPLQRIYSNRRDHSTIIIITKKNIDRLHRP